MGNCLLLCHLDLEKREGLVFGIIFLNILILGRGPTFDELLLQIALTNYNMVSKFEFALSNQ